MFKQITAIVTSTRTTR